MEESKAWEGIPNNYTLEVLNIKKFFNYIAHIVKQIIFSFWKVHGDSLIFLSTEKSYLWPFSVLLVYVLWNSLAANQVILFCCRTYTHLSFVRAFYLFGLKAYGLQTMPEIKS